MEVLLIALLFLAPWALGANEPIFEFWLDLGLTVCLALWGLRMLLAGRLTWVKCPVVLGLAGLFWLGALQLVPLPPSLLSRIAPATAHLYQELLPQQPEQLAMDPATNPPSMVAGHTLSVYPWKTRRELLRLLAVLLVFALVRNNIASPASLQRLFIVLVINGSLLALFAIIQFSSSSPKTVYWSIKMPAMVFGPFLSHTHYPFYVNVCIGAGLGLLIAQRQRAAAGQSASAGWGWQSLLENPIELWLLCSLALMVVSVLLSLGRGGFLGLLAGCFCLLLLRPARVRGVNWILPAAVLGILALALLGWLGLDQVEKRLATLSSGEAMTRGRWPLWRDTVRLVPDFFLWGSGAGTFQFVEPLARTADPHQVVYEYAHNELLDALIEGGILRLGLTLLILVLIAVLGVRAVRRNAGTPVAGLALGALFGFTTLVVQSLGDFGVHLPSIALLAAVLSAQLVSLGMAPPSPSSVSLSPRTEPPGLSRRSSRRDKPGGSLPSEEATVTPPAAYTFGRLPATGVATVLLALGLLITVDGWRLYRADAYRSVARGLQGHWDPAAHEVRVNNLKMAVRFAPDHVRIRNDLAQAHLDAYQLQLRGLSDHWAFATVTQLIAGPMTARVEGGLSVLQMAILYRLTALGGPEPLFPAAFAKARRDHLLPALQQFVLARDTCPLLAQPQIMIASFHPFFRQADSRQAYLDRARRLVTNDPILWYLFGLQDYLDGQLDRAARSWQRSLQLNSSEFPAMLEVMRKHPPRPDFVLERIVPDDPEVLLTVGAEAARRGEPVAQVRALWEKGLRLARERHASPEAADLELQGRLLRQLDRPAEAITAYREALRLQPRQAQWHYALAVLLLQQKEFRKAQDELRISLGLQPENTAAAELLHKLTSALEQPR